MTTRLSVGFKFPRSCEDAFPNATDGRTMYSVRYPPAVVVAVAGAGAVTAAAKGGPSKTEVFGDFGGEESLETGR